MPAFCGLTLRAAGNMNDKSDREHRLHPVTPRDLTVRASWLVRRNRNCLTVRDPNVR